MHKFILAAALALAAAPATAAPVLTEFLVNVQFSNFPGVAFGDAFKIDVRHDDAFATPGIAALTPGAGLLDVTIDIGGKVIDDSDDFEFPLFPLLTLLDGKIELLSLITADYKFELLGFPGLVFVTDSAGRGELFIAGTAQQVPAPGAIALLGLGAMFLASARHLRLV